MTKEINCLKYLSSSLLGHISIFLGCALHGKDHYGDDIKRVSADTYQECGSKCINYPSCKRWTFKHFSASPESSKRNMSLGMCVLNHGKNYSLKKCQNCVSGFRNSNLGKKCKMNGKLKRHYIPS